MPTTHVGNAYVSLAPSLTGPTGLNVDRQDRDPELTSILTDYMDKLATYGTTEALAMAFEEAGVQALPSASDRCAIAEHAAMTMDLPEDVTVQVGGSSVLLQRETERTVRMPSGMPDAVVRDVQLVADVRHNEVTGQFIHEFDSYKYPSIVHPESLAAHRAKQQRMREEMANRKAASIKAEVAEHYLATHPAHGLSAESVKAIEDLVTCPQKYMAGAIEW